MSIKGNDTRNKVTRLKAADKTLNPVINNSPARKEIKLAKAQAKAKKQTSLLKPIKAVTKLELK